MSGFKKQMTLHTVCVILITLFSLPEVQFPHFLIGNDTYYTRLFSRINDVLRWPSDAI